MAPEITLVARLARSGHRRPARGRPAASRGHRRARICSRGTRWRSPGAGHDRARRSRRRPAGQATLDDITLSNAGLTDGATVVVAPGGVAAARVVRLTGSSLARAALTPETVRVALLGKIVTRGDAVSLLPRDIEPVPGADPVAARRQVAGALGAGWTSELLTVAAVEPAGAVAVRPSTVVGWEGGARPATRGRRPRRRAPLDDRGPSRRRGRPQQASRLARPGSGERRRGGNRGARCPTPERGAGHAGRRRPSSPSRTSSATRPPRTASSSGSSSPSTARSCWNASAARRGWAC